MMVLIMQLDNDFPGAQGLTIYGLTQNNPKVTASAPDLGWTKNDLLYCVFVIFQDQSCITWQINNRPLKYYTT